MKQEQTHIKEQNDSEECNPTEAAHNSTPKFETTTPGAVIYLLGPDGAGKSTIAQTLADKFKEQGFLTETKWLRFNHVFIKPINLIGRALGWSYTESYPDGTKLGYHDYWKNWIFSKVFTWITIFDTYLTYIFTARHIKPTPGKVTIIDRFALDTLADIMIETKVSGLPNSAVGRALHSMIPSHWKPFIILVPYETILERRPSLKYDRELRNRIAAYEDISKCFKVSIIDNSTGIDHTLSEISSLLASHEKEVSLHP